MLTLTDIRKTFGGVRALERVELELLAGRVTALIGENGAGKSTLVKILTGIHQPDGGEIRIDGAVVRMASPQAARALGIGVVHQECQVFDNLSVAENLFIHSHPTRRGLVNTTPRPGRRVRPAQRSISALRSRSSSSQRAASRRSSSVAGSGRS